MINFKTILPLVLGIIIGISFTNLFKGCGSATEPVSIVKNTRPSVIEKHVAEVESSFQQKIDSFKTISTALVKQLGQTRKTLSDARNKNLVLQTQVYDLIDRQPVNTDTVTVNRDCDSLKVKVVELIHSNNEKDSLCEDMNTNLEMQLKNKDSTIAVKDTGYQSLKSSFAESIAQQQGLFEQNKGFQQQFKRQKVKSKLLSAALLIVSGAAANFLIHR